MVEDVDEEGVRGLATATSLSFGSGSCIEWSSPVSLLTSRVRGTVLFAVATATVTLSLFCVGWSFDVVDPGPLLTSDSCIGYSSAVSLLTDRMRGTVLFLDPPDTVTLSLFSVV